MGRTRLQAPADANDRFTIRRLISGLSGSSNNEVALTASNQCPLLDRRRRDHNGRDEGAKRPFFAAARKVRDGRLADTNSSVTGKFPNDLSAHLCHAGRANFEPKGKRRALGTAGSGRLLEGSFGQGCGRVSLSLQVAAAGPFMVATKTFTGPGSRRPQQRGGRAAEATSQILPVDP